MKALVTGASGFVGFHIAQALLAAGHEVTVFHRPSSPTGNLGRLPVRRIAGDVLDDAAVRRAVAGQDEVFHAAGLYALWARNPRDFWDVNVEGTRRVLRASADAGARRIVYTSTVSAVRGSALGEVADERSVWNLEQAADPYVNSKRKAEEIAIDLATSGAPVVVVCPGGPIGPDDIRPTPTGDLLVKFVNGALPGYTEGGVNLVDVRDVARGHLLAASRGAIGERYILGGRNLTIASLMELLSKVTGLPSPRLYIPTWAAFALASVLDVAAGRVLRIAPPLTRSSVRLLRSHLHVSSAKAERDLGFSSRPLELPIRDAIEDFHRRGLLSQRRMRRVLAHWASVA